MTKPTGGPAFPRPISHVQGEVSGDQDGMSLRVYIATHTLAAIIAHPGKKPKGIDGPKIYAIWAREYADALLEELERKY